jgi:lipopolysaccharide heptosyltransferase II
MKLKDQKVLIIKLLYVGDTLGVIPVAAKLKQEAPLAIVDALVNQGTDQLLTHHPAFRKIWRYDRQLAKRDIRSSVLYHIGLARRLRSERYDIVIALSGNDRSYFLSFLTGASVRTTHRTSHRLSKLLMNRFICPEASKFHFLDYDLEHLRLFGIEPANKDLKIYVPPSVESEIDRHLSAAKITSGFPGVAIHPGARQRMRQWRPERFADIARRLHEKYNARIILIGGPNEDNLVRKIEECMGFPASFKSDSLSLLEMAALFARCHLFVGNDSGPGHIAAAMNCPTLTLFGPNYPHICRPFGSRSEVIFKALPCCGCRHEETYCIRPQNSCMDLIEVDEVWEKVQELLSQSGFQPQ